MSRALVGGLPPFNSINYGRENETLEDVDIGNILKLFNLGNVSDEELERKISELLAVDINTSEELSLINTLYEKAVKTYIETFLIQLKAPFYPFVFRQKSDFLEFLRNTKRSKRPERRQIYCDLVKIMFCYNEVEKHSQMKNAEKNTKDFISKNFLTKGVILTGDFEFNLASVMEKKEGKDFFETQGAYFKKMPSGGFKKISCTLRFRGKSAEKMVIKMLGSEKGSSKILDLIKDSIGLELEAENKEESIYLLEYLYYLHKEQGTIDQTEFRQKPGFYTKNDIKKFSEQEDLSEEFRSYLSSKLDTLKKENGTMKYKDCKFQGMIDIGNGRLNGCESRVVIKGNKNQSGLSASEIVDGKKIRNAMIGLRGWVSASYINRIVDNIVKKTHITKGKKLISDELFNKLVKVSIPKLNRNIYSSSQRLEEIIKNASEYPDFIINAIQKVYPGCSVDEIIEAVKSGTQENLLRN